MSTTGEVEITILDNAGAANIVTAAPSVVAIFGVSSAGTPNVPVSTRSIATLTSTFGYGPLVELGALLISQGATVIATKVAQSAAGTASTVVGEQGTSAWTTTLDATVGAFDTYFVQIVVLSGGTVGVASATMKIQVSLDAGRTFGPVQVVDISMATPTYVIPNTGITINVGAGTVDPSTATSPVRFGTKEPQPGVGNIQTAITALANSVYAQSGWGSVIIHAPAFTGAMTTANVNTIQSTLDTMATNQLFDRAMINVRDADLAASPWGGAGVESDATYTTTLVTNAAARNAKRMLAAAGYYNIPSGIANSVAGTPRHRRPGSWAIQARKVAVAVQTLSSRVKDGPLSTIIVDTTSDPTDGFVYHDERINPGLDAVGYASFWTRLQQGSGFFVRSENLFSPPSSDFDLFAVGQCFDNFCSTLVQYFTASIDESVRTNANGTIYENDAQQLESGALAAVAAAMPGQYQAANTSVVIDRSYNVMTNKKALVTGVFGQLGYIREFDLTVQLQNPLAS
jgi:hypothetical protein